MWSWYPLGWPWGDGGQPAALPLESLSGHWHWQAGDVGGNVSPDYSGNGRNGTTHGGAYASDGTYGTVWEQDGTSSDWIEVPTGAFAAGTQPTTLLAFVKPASSTGGYTWAAAFGDAEAFFLGIHGDEALGGGFFPDFVESSSGPIVADTWLALAIVYDGSSLALYVDGALVASGAASLTHGSATSYIGRQVSFFGEYWLGQIGVVAAFDGVALSHAEVAAWAADPFGSLILPAAVAGTASGTGGASGSLGLLVDVAGSVGGTGDASGTLMLVVAVSGAASGTGGASGTLSLSTALSGVAAGVGGASGTLTFGATPGPHCDHGGDCFPLGGVDGDCIAPSAGGTVADDGDCFPLGWIDGDCYPLGDEIGGGEAAEAVADGDCFPPGGVDGDLGCCNSGCGG